MTHEHAQTIGAQTIGAQTLEVEMIGEATHTTASWVSTPTEVVHDSLTELGAEILAKVQLEALQSERTLRGAATVWLDELRAAGRSGALRTGEIPPVTDQVAEYVAGETQLLRIMEEIIAEYAVTHVPNRATRRAAKRRKGK